jgi:hypothetical protein
MSSGFNLVDVVVGVVAVSHLLACRFVVFWVAKRDGAGIHRLVRRLGHHRHHGGGINATREEGTQRHFRHHADFYRLTEAVHEFDLASSS